MMIWQGWLSWCFMCKYASHVAFDKDLGLWSEKCFSPPPHLLLFLQHHSVSFFLLHKIIAKLCILSTIYKLLDSIILNEMFVFATIKHWILICRASQKWCDRGRGGRPLFAFCGKGFGQKDSVQKYFVRKDFVQKDFVQKDFAQRDLAQKDFVQRYFVRIYCTKILYKDNDSYSFSCWRRYDKHKRNEIFSCLIQASLSSSLWCLAWEGCKHVVHALINE